MGRKPEAGEREAAVEEIRAEERAADDSGKSVGDGRAASQSKASHSSAARPRRRSSLRRRRRGTNSRRVRLEGGGAR